MTLVMPHIPAGRLHVHAAGSMSRVLAGSDIDDASVTVSFCLPNHTVNTCCHSDLPNQTVNTWCHSDLPNQTVNTWCHSDLPNQTVNTWCHSDLPNHTVNTWYMKLPEVNLNCRVRVYHTETRAKDMPYVFMYRTLSLVLIEKHH